MYKLLNAMFTKKRQNFTHCLTVRLEKEAETFDVIMKICFAN